MRVAIFGTVGGITGYSSCVRGVSHYLRTLGVETDIFPIQSPDRQFWDVPEVLAQSIKKEEKGKYDIKLAIVNPFYLDNFVDPTEFVIYTTFECDRIPVAWVHRSMAARAVVTTSQFAHDIFANDGIESKVAPEGYDEHFFYPQKLPHSRFRFLAVKEWMPRKNIQKLIRVFSDTFAGKNDVELFLKTWNSHGLPPGEMEDVINYHNRGRARIVPIFTPMPDNKLIDLYAQCDVHVSATRGEGFGRPQLESMATGMPNIATGWSAHTEFVNDKNGWLAKYNLEPVMPHFSEYSDDMMWAEVDEIDLSEKMLYAYEHPEEVREKGIVAAQDAKAWTWTKSAKKMVRALEEIVEGK